MAINPSLLIIPDRFKASKLYSQLPESGDGDFTVVRGTTATRVNASGLIESVASGVPRIDYTDGGCGKLLVEPAATNLALYSEEFDDASWTKARLNAFGSGSIANAITAPDGTTSADYIQQETGQTNGGLVSVILSISGAHSWSVFAKAGEFEFLAIRTRSATFTSSYFNLTNGTVALVHPDHSNVQITSFGNGWYKCSLSDAGGALANRFSVGGRDGANDTVTPDRGVYIWGAQPETGSVATSYIPTVGTTVTRNADVISLSSASGLIGQSEGTLFADILQNELKTEIGQIMQIGTILSRVYIFKESATENIYQIATQSSAGFNFVNTSNLPLGRLKIAIAYQEGNNALYINGSQISFPSATLNPTSFSQLAFNNDESKKTFFLLNVAALYTSRLSNSELQALTTL